jgi:predicted RNase H-like nuclease (RuvC/YqgF family)
VNWCQPNRTGIARLNSYFDPNDRKYYVTRESVERAIQEEIQRARKTNEPSEAFGTVPNRSEKQKPASESTRTDERLIRDMEREIADLKIANRVKDSFIEHLQNQADGILGQLVESSRKNGELETRLLQLEGPKNRLHQEEA